MHANTDKAQEMKTDIIISGVGGQGILSIATILAEAATIAGIHLKQSEIHGMSQRGGYVLSDLRLSEETIWSDLIPAGEADIILSMEPMEALRHYSRLKPDGAVITSSAPLRNIPDYPDEQEVFTALKSIETCKIIDIDKMAKEEGNPKGANMVLLGAAAKFISVLSKDDIIRAISNVFARKGEEIIQSNISLFNKAYETI